MTRIGADAVHYARGRVGPNAMPASGYCLQFVRECFAVSSYYSSAIDAWNGAQRKHPGDRNPPMAVPLYFRTPSQYDHVVFGGDPGGQEIITTFNDDVRRYTGPDAIAQIERDFDGSYLGWAEDINRVTVYIPGEDEDMPSTQEITDAVGERVKEIFRSPEFQGYWINNPWGFVINGNNPTTGEPWSDAASAWLRDARIDSKTDHVADVVWDTVPEDVVVAADSRDHLALIAVVVLLAVIGGVAVGLLTDTTSGVIAGLAAIVGGLLALGLRALPRGRGRRRGA